LRLLGMRNDVLVPCYGMAETVLATSIALQPYPPGETAFGRVYGRRSPENGQLVVSCGRPVDGLRLRVLSSDGEVLADGAVGDIQVSGPSVMRGYLRPD
ncbi:AMP-binding protein, partial [Mycobacteroides abscessus subsp. massiliense]